MTTEQAWSIVGNTNKIHLGNMIQALEMFPWLNTREDKVHLEAAKLAIKTNNPRYEG
jgi:hypothetical protein